MNDLSGSAFNGRSVAHRSLRRVRRLLAGDRLALGSLVVLAAVTLLAVFGPYVAGDVTQGVALSERLIPPIWGDGGTWSHILGTDPLGRDEIALLVAGARVSISTGFFVVIIAGSFGTLLGVVAGYRRGWIETILMRTVDSVVAFPGLLLALIVLAVLGPSQSTVIVVLTALGWMVFARTAHDRVLELRSTPYIKAAESMGARGSRIVGRHLLPNLVLPILTIGLLEFARVILAEASLSYLGMGIQPPQSSWGLMVAEGQRYIATSWWLVTLPGLALAGTVLSVNVLGNRLRSGGQDFAFDGGEAPSDAKKSQNGAPLVGAQGVRHEVGNSPQEMLLSVQGLSVSIPTERGVVRAVRGVDLGIAAGETVGIVGESGSGKTMTALAVMGLLPRGAHMRGRISWKGEALDESNVRRLRGRAITMVFQDPVASLNPLVHVGRQIREVLQLHKGASAKQAQAQAVELLDHVGIPSPARTMERFPWELSGGMCQRVMLAIALAPSPQLIIADEPTTALDVTIQAQLLQLLRDLQDEFHMAIGLITHDLGVVAGMCDRLVVMEGGRVVERGSVREIFYSPADKYTANLIAATPRLDGQSA